MVTIRDVARLAGVAPITVSRVVNHDEHVSPATRRRVEDAIAELAYVPNSLGTSLRSKRTGTLALVLSDIVNPFWTTVARGVEDAANRHGHHIIICNTDESPAKQEEYLSSCSRSRWTASCCCRPRCGRCTNCIRRGKAVVVLDRRVPAAEVDTVRGDSEAGRSRSAAHLVELGHRRIAAISGPRDVSTSEDRVAGYMRALAEAGLSDLAARCTGATTRRRVVGQRRGTDADGPSPDRHLRRQQLPRVRRHASPAGPMATSPGGRLRRRLR